MAKLKERSRPSIERRLGKNFEEIPSDIIEALS
jgi:hypothetical protein